MAHVKKKTTKKEAQRPKKIYKLFSRPKSFLSDIWPNLTLFFITLTLCYLNYDSNTFLSGWDNLHPEFNPKLYLSRTFFAVWQEYQSTGLLGGMAHAADLPRVLLIYLLSLVSFPTNLMRYFTTFLPLIAGPIGVLILTKRILSKSHFTSQTIKISSFLTGLFYLLNLSTMQTFFIPFETFTWFYGAFPFLIYFLINYQEKPKTSNFLRLFLVSFLAGTAFYVETIFVVFGISLLPFLVKNITKDKKIAKNLLHTLFSLFAIIFSQLYWLLPVAFFVLTNGQVTTQNHINSISSIETYYRNLEFANLPNIFSLHSYLFKYLDLGLNGKYELLLTPWINHLNSPIAIIINFIIIFLIILGIYYSLKTKIAYSRSFLWTFIVSAFFLLGGGQLINTFVPLIGELLRSPFTKFSLPLSFSMSFFFAIGVIFILDIFSFLDARLSYGLTLFTITFLLFTYLSPGFSGNFINKNMRVAIPSEYFDLFSYLDKQPVDNRIANFPQYTFWGWNYYNWGHRGSGFTWYGIKQPILDRAFDVWDQNSQNYYEEISAALYAQDNDYFNKIIDKYDVSYLLIDKNIIAPDTKASLGLDYLQEILDSSEQYQVEKTFNNLILYKNNNHNTQNFLSIQNKSSDNKQLLDFSYRPNQNWYQKANLINTNLEINNQPPKTINIPSPTTTENLLPYKIEYKTNFKNITLRFTPILPIFFTDNKQIDLAEKSQIITIPLTTSTSKVILSLNSEYLAFDLPSETTNLTEYYYLSEVYLPTNKLFPIGLYQGIPTEQYPLINSLINNKPKQCYTQKENRNLEMITAPRTVTLLGTDVVGCLSAPLPPVTPDQLLVASFTYYSPSLTTANVNVTNQQFGTTNKSQPFASSQTPKRAQIFFEPSPDNTQINLILEAEDTKTIQEITYKDIYLSSHNPIYQANLKLNQLPPTTINLKENAQDVKIQISLPITKSSLDIIQTPNSNGLFPESRNCDQFNSGKVVKINRESDILYQSQNAIQCDYLNLRHLPHTLNYILSFSALNTKGLPLEVCLENHATRRCDIFERFYDTNKEQSIIQPIKNPNEQNGYTLHLFNQSFGNIIGENVLESITTHPFPLNFLQNITINENESSSPKVNPATYKSTHPAEYLYTIYQIENNATDQQLNLYQTSSPYWKAVLTPRSNNPWITTLQILANYTKLTKLTKSENNYWYNSWDIPENIPENYQITIIYLPQYLEFFGIFVLLIVPLITLPVILYQSSKK